jgi:ubiquinone/menaquinone biosynthesis C-methylase UbiE
MAVPHTSGGSQYENYNSTSITYDTGRQVVGLEVILGALAHARSQQKQLNKLQILDAGCGTGNCTLALSPFVGNVNGLEHSKGMLEMAQKKTEHLSNVKLQEGDITDMPFLDNHFDGVIVNQVLHHLTQPGRDYSQVNKFFQEAHRVLVPHGALIINVSSPLQSSSAIWYCDIVPEATSKLVERTPAMEYLTSTLTEVGFKIGGVYTLLDELLVNPEVYMQKDGPFDEKWRNMDSTWSLATATELEAGLQQWREQLENGVADEIIAKYEEQRRKIGMTTSIVAYKV